MSRLWISANNWVHNQYQYLISDKLSSSVWVRDCESVLFFFKLSHSRVQIGKRPPCNLWKICHLLTAFMYLRWQTGIPEIESATPSTSVWLFPITRQVHRSPGWRKPVSKQLQSSHSLSFWRRFANNCGHIYKYRQLDCILLAIWVSLWAQPSLYNRDRKSTGFPIALFRLYSYIKGRLLSISVILQSNLCPA